MVLDVEHVVLGLDGGGILAGIEAVAGQELVEQERLLVPGQATASSASQRVFSREDTRKAPVAAGARPQDGWLGAARPGRVD